MAKKPTSVSSVTTLPSRPEPPRTLPAAAKATWESIVADYPPKHFRGANLNLLEQFCRATAMAQECDGILEREGLFVDGKPHAAVALRTMAWREMRSAATRLRLNIASLQRADSAKARPNDANQLRKPWEIA